jgi:hypothetical protein
VKRKLQEMSCRKALNRLDDKGYITLPKVTNDYAYNHTKRDVKKALPVLREVHRNLDSLGKIEIILIENRQHINSSIWHALMKEYHPLSNGPLCGRQIRYLVMTSKFWLAGSPSFQRCSMVSERPGHLDWME